MGIEAFDGTQEIGSFFKFCADRKWIADNPAKPLKAPKEVAIEKKPYDAAELEKIAWAIPLFPIKGIYGEKNRERIVAFVAVLRWTGLRIRDVVQLKRSMVADGFITLRTHKNGKPVQLPLHPEMKSSLEKNKQRRVFLLVRRLSKAGYVPSSGNSPNDILRSYFTAFAV